MIESDNIIIVENLVKRFGDLNAVDDITFQVQKKEIFAFLGPNGAGKTTLIKVLITLIPPTSGKALVGGFDISRNAGKVRKIIGYVPQMISVDGTLTAYENLLLMARLYDIPRKEQKSRVIDVLKFLDLADHADKLVRTFSGGMIRKLEVGQAMLNHPPVLFLDEPTTGLDPIAKQSVWDHLLEIRNKFDTTIFFSTHNMEEAAAVASRVAIMNAGKIAVIGKVNELTEKTKKENATLEDAFIFFTGNTIRETSGYREARRSRQKQNRLG